MATKVRGTTGGPDPAASLLALRAQLNGSIHTLWAVYSAVGGAAAAFGSSAGVTLIGAGAVTFMFWVFTGGHLALLRQTLRASDAVRRDIDEARRNGRLAGSLLKNAIKEGAANRNPLGKNTTIHVILDLFITGAIWAKFLAQSMGFTLSSGLRIVVELS